VTVEIPGALDAMSVLSDKMAQKVKNAFIKIFSLSLAILSAALDSL
jgi:hypothetical protein